MAERLHVHPVNPQSRLVDKAAAVLKAGGLALAPTDAGYALVWALESKAAEERVQRLRELDSKHPFTLLCRQLSEAGRLARLDDPAFRLMRSLTPGPCTFILPASADLPKRIKNSGRSKRRDIGIRLPDHVVTRALLEAWPDAAAATGASVAQMQEEGHSRLAGPLLAVAAALINLSINVARLSVRVAISTGP